jgi:hypothetical protein
MNDLISKLTELNKALKTANALPSPKLPKAPIAPKIDSPNNVPKQPTLTPTSQKDPMKQAQQVQDPSTKIQAVKMAKEKVKLSKNGQWELQKWNMEKRCWEGYEPTPGKKAYEDDSCRPTKKGEFAPEGSVNRETYKENFEKSLTDNEIEISEWNDGTIELIAGSAVNDAYIEFISKSICEKCNMIDMYKKEWSPKAEHKSDKGGLTEAGRKSYNRATGGNLKAPQPGGGPRKRSFCARNKGQIDMHNIDCRATPDKRACKARRRWKC